jgi:hypothetical protein
MMEAIGKKIRLGAIVLAGEVIVWSRILNSLPSHLFIGTEKN